MEHPNARIARAVYEGFNDRDFDRSLESLAEDCAWTNLPTAETFSGREGFRRNLERWATAYPDGRCEDIHVIATDDYVVVEFMGRGTNSGPMVTPEGELPATGRRVEIPFCDVHRIDDGKITNGRSYFDMATMLRQLGLAPEVTAGAAKS